MKNYFSPQIHTWHLASSLPLLAGSGDNNPFNVSSSIGSITYGTSGGSVDDGV